MYYFGMFVTPSTPAAAYFSVMTIFNNGTQLAPPENSNISLSTRILSSRDENPDATPSITATWTTLVNHQNYTFYKFLHECGMNPLVNELSYIIQNAVPFLNVYTDELGVSSASAVLTGFEDTIDAFCINVIALDMYGNPGTAWMAQTIYYPHIRDGVQPQQVNWRKWSAGIWAEVVLTAMLFIGAPIGIIVHRIWISRRRAQKRRDALLSGPTWIN